MNFFKFGLFFSCALICRLGYVSGDSDDKDTSGQQRDSAKAAGSIIYAEPGEPDETLLDQVKRLSEDIKKKQNEGVKDEGAARHKRDTRDVGDDIHVVKSGNVPSSEDVSSDNRKTHGSDQTFEQTQEKNGDIREETDEPEETIMDQILILEKRIDDIALGEPDLVPSYDNTNAPDDAELEKIFGEIDELGRSVDDDDTFDFDKEFSIGNTAPPKTDILPSETLVIKNMERGHQSTDDNKNIRATPGLDNVKSTIHDASTMKDSKIHATATIKHEKSVVKQLTGKEKLKKRLEKRRKDVVSDKTRQTISETDSPTKVQMLSSASYDNKEASYTVETQFVATAQTNVKEVMKSLDTSEDKPRGTIYDTEAFKEKPQVIAATESVNKEELHKPTASNVYKDPSDVIEKMSKYDEPKQDKPEPSTDTEKSEEEILKMEQAQKYFEDGEKLINNSYKKDFQQAYEYFKIAADMGHTKALEYLGFGYLLGDYVPLDPSKALSTFQYLSDKGAPKGQLGLGFSYSSGLAVDSSQAKALIYFSFAALGGDSLAQMVLGYRYLAGVGVESKCETALTYYRKVATTVAEQTSSGSPVVQRIRLHEHAENKDNGAGSLMDDDLLQYYEFLADKGDVQAQVVLGQLYYQGGRGVTVNHERAQHYFLMAAESGNGNALAFLGKMHSEGSPVVEQDHDTAFQYYQKAAEKANPIGQCGLGIMYLYGKGVEKDYAKALKYFSQSSDQGWSDAQLHLGIMHFGGKGVRGDYKMAVKYFNLASQGGHVLAFYHLAQMHATGVGVLRNCHTAVELYKNVAERGPWSSMLVEAHELYKSGHVNEALLKYTFLAELGYEVAQTNVAYILDNGESTLFDEKETYQRALLHWTRAASQGSTVARLKMGDYHYYGYGTEIDYETAATHYRLATEQQHNAQAMFNLGYMHENGLGLKRDVHLAKRFYDMAAETSGDAYIPVTLALFKLGMFYGTEVFNKEIETYYNFLNKLDVRYQLGPNWDVYIATFLAIILSIVVVVVRQNR